MNVPEIALASALFYTLFCLFKFVIVFPRSGRTARNEGIKLTATALSNVGVAFVVVGVVTPLVQGLSAPSRDPDRGMWFVVLFVLGCGLHLLARLMLSDLQD